MSKEREELQKILDSLNETQIAYILRLIKNLFGSS